MAGGATPPSREPDPSAERPHGVSLEQYAGITTAVAEGFPLGAVLANERLSPASWAEAEPAWKVRVARDGVSGQVFAELEQKRRIAEDTLARAVAPIDADLAAWMSFLRAYAAHPAPFAMLKEAGLGLNDLSRLQRGWARRMAEDRGLEKEAADLAKRGPGPLPPIRVQPGTLKRFPWSPGPAEAPKPVAPKVAAPAETSLAPGQMRLFNYVAIKAQVLERPAEAERLLKELGMTDFAATDAGWQEILRSNPDLDRDYRRLLDARRAKIRSAAKEGSPRAAPAPAKTVAPGPSPGPRGAPSPSMPPVVRAPSKLAGTALAEDVPRKAALPFVAGSAPGAPLAPLPPSMPPEPPRPSGRADLGGTSLAFESPSRAALPFPAVQPSNAPPTPPSLTLEQHASLCCELTEAPDRAAETLARYQVTPAQKQAADQHYAARFAADPASRAAWDRAYTTYRAWWLAQRR